MEKVDIKKLFKETNQSAKGFALSLLPDASASEIRQIQRIANGDVESRMQVCLVREVLVLRGLIQRRQELERAKKDWEENLAAYVDKG